MRATHIAGVGFSYAMAVSLAIAYKKHTSEYGHTYREEEVTSKGPVFIPDSGAPIQRSWKTGEVILVTDVLVEGADELRACRKLESSGLSVQRIVSVTDYEIGGREALEKANYKVTVIAPMSEII